MRDYLLYTCRVEIPVIIMGETGCGKTKLIDFMSKLQVPTALNEKIQTMIIVKVSGAAMNITCLLLFEILNS